VIALDVLSRILSLRNNLLSGTIPSTIGAMSTLM
jgi:hypothetical protein